MDLAVHPKWKLLKLDEFTGSFFSEVWEYLEELKPEPAGMPEYLKALPEPKTNIAQDCLAHVKKLLGEGTKEEKDQWEREGIAALRKKYPAQVWACGRAGNKNF